MDLLILVPARGDSKGIPGKNIKLLAGKPLISYSIDVARKICADRDICISTDNDEIIDFVESTGLIVPFKRPAELATDRAGTYDVIVHALDYFEKEGRKYDTVLLLQPTSPLRLPSHLHEAVKLYTVNTDMVVSVMEAKSNPSINLLKEGPDGFLHRLSEKGITRRQDAPTLWQLNGSIYLINCDTLRKYTSFWEFPRITKYVMQEQYSVDIDTQFDFELAEWLISEKKYLETNGTPPH